MLVQGQQNSMGRMYKRNSSKSQIAAAIPKLRLAVALMLFVGMASVLTAGESAFFLRLHLPAI